MYYLRLPKVILRFPLLLVGLGLSFQRLFFLLLAFVCFFVVNISPVFAATGSFVIVKYQATNGFPVCQPFDDGTMGLQYNWIDFQSQISVQDVSTVNISLETLDLDPVDFGYWCDTTFYNTSETTIWLNHDGITTRVGGSYFVRDVSFEIKSDSFSCEVPVPAAAPSYNFQNDLERIKSKRSLHSFDIDLIGDYEIATSPTLPLAIGGYRRDINLGGLINLKYFFYSMIMWRVFFK